MKASAQLLNTMNKLDRDAIVIAINDIERAECSVMNLMPREASHPEWVLWSKKLADLYFIRLELQKMLEAKGQA